MQIESPRTSLVEVTVDDVKDIHLLHSFTEVDEFNTLGIPTDIHETETFIQNIIEQQNNKPQKSYAWKITLIDTNEFLGLAGLTLSLDKFRRGEIYYKFMPKHWGKGYATEVAKLLIRTGFDHFYLHRVEAGVATDNIASIKVLEKSGMTREGLRRKILPIRGEWKDNYHYAMVEDDPGDY